MATRELHRLKRRDLLKMLLAQCEETERLQQETEEMQEQMKVALENYERLKKKLDVKDERLNQKDSKIAELRDQVKALLAEKEAGEEKLHKIEVSFYQCKEIFEEIQKAAERYMTKPKKHNAGKEPLELGRIISIRKKQNYG